MVGGVTLSQPARGKVPPTSSQCRFGITTNGGEIAQDKQLNNSKRKASKPQTDRRTSFNTNCPHLHKRMQDMVDGVTLN